MKLETARLRIRPFRLEDERAVLIAMGSTEISALYADTLRTSDAVRHFLEARIAEYRSGRPRAFCIADKASDILVGCITAQYTPQLMRVELTFWITEPAQHRGFATEAVRAVLFQCFRLPMVQRVQALAYTPVTARLLTRAGMVCEGTLKRYLNVGGTLRDCQMFAVVRDVPEQTNE